MIDLPEYQVCEDVFAPCNDFSFIDQRLSEQNQNLAEYTECLNATIVIPHYNSSKLLERTLTGISQQTIDNRNFQIVICDDGSNEDLTEIQDKWGDRFGDFKIISEPKQGFRLSRMRNLGLQVAIHKNIILLDCDMIPKKDLVEQHVRVLNTCSYCISIGYRHHRNIETLTELELLALLDKEFTFSELDWRVRDIENKQDALYKLKYDSYFAWSCVSGGNLGLTKAVLEEAIFFDENFVFWGGEDNEWAYRLFKKGFYFYPNFKAIAIHQDQDSNAQVARNECLEYLQKKCPRIADAYKNTNYTSDDIPLVSFWMCNNNRSMYLEKAIRSLTTCPYRFEIVFVDDASTDNSVELVKELMLAIPQIRLFHKEKGPLGQGFKKALDLCRGELLIQIDSDDYIENMGYLVELMIWALFSEYDLVYGHHFLVDKEDNFLGEGWTFPKCDRTKALFEGMHMHPPRIIHCRSYNRARLVDAELETAVDYDIYSKILEVAKGLFIDKNIYAYRQHENSISANYEDSQKNNVAKIISDRLKYYNVFDKFSFDDAIPRACKVTLNGHPKLRIENKFTRK
jgi:chondroitin synthase